MDKKLRSKEVGLFSLVTIISQLVSGNISTQALKDDLNKVQLEISSLRLERAEHYVNKADFQVLGLKVDKANDQLLSLKTQTAALKQFLKSRLHYNYSLMPQSEHVTFGLMSSEKTHYDN